MNYLEFSAALRGFPAFSAAETGKLPGKVYPHRLVEWQRKGYLQKVVNGLYRFTNEELNDFGLMYLANRIYTPSYVSLESALSWYGFIPEAVYRITSVSTRKTNSFESEGVHYNYRKIMPRFFFGYRLMSWRQSYIRIAEPEKTLLDFFYLNSGVTTAEHLEELRLNYDEIRDIISREKLMAYLGIYKSRALNSRIKLLLKAVYDQSE